MTKDERLAAALAALPESAREAVESVLRALTHDLNGALSAVTMEAFSIAQLAANVADAAALRRAPDETRRQLDTLLEAARNLRQAADGAASYVARVEALIEEPRKQK